MQKRPQNRFPLAIRAGYQENALFGFAQLSITSFYQADPALVAEQGFLKTDATLFQIPYHFFQSRQGLFKSHILRG
jgi:hypothetical protein